MLKKNLYNFTTEKKNIKSKKKTMGCRGSKDPNFQRENQVLPRRRSLDNKNPLMSEGDELKWTSRPNVIVIDKLDDSDKFNFVECLSKGDD